MTQAPRAGEAPTGGWSWRATVAAGVSGLALLAALVALAPARLDLDIGTAMPATVAGMHPRELHYGRHIRWTDGQGRLELPPIVGIAPDGLELELAAFMGRHGDTLRLVVDPGSTLRHTLGHDWDVIWMPLRPPPTGVTLHLQSPAYFAPGDARRLGVRLDRVTVVNGSHSARWRALTWWHACVVVLVGAAGWCLGAMLARPSASRVRWAPAVAGTGVVVALGVLLAWWRPWLLHPASLRAMAGAVVLGATLLWLLRARGTSTRRATSAARVAVAAAVSICWLALTLVTLHYFVDAPRWDIWDVVDLIARVHDGRFTISDLWRPHNEHRPLTARLVILPNALWFHWNHWIEFGALMASVAWLLLIYCRFIARTQHGAQRIAPSALVAVAIVTCSLTQWENWLRGYHVHIVMGAVGPVLASYWLATGATSLQRFALALSAALVGVLSFGTGLLAWPLGALAILVRRGRGWLVRLGIWCTVSVAVVVWYRAGLPHRPGLSEVALGSPTEMLRVTAGTLVSIAMPLAYVPEVFATSVTFAQVLVVCGAAAAVLLALGLTWRHWRADTAGERTWLFPSLLVAFGLGAGLLASLGRASLGLYALTASRYLVFMACFWSGLFLLLALRDAQQGRRWRQGTAVLAVTLAVAMTMMWPRALPYMAADADGGWHAREELRRGNAEAATVLFPNGLLLAQMRQVLERHRLSLFRPR